MNPDQSLELSPMQKETIITLINQKKSERMERIGGERVKDDAEYQHYQSINFIINAPKAVSDTHLLKHPFTTKELDALYMLLRQAERTAQADAFKDSNNDRLAQELAFIQSLERKITKLIKSGVSYAT